uniref:UPAR/Ly6 domain-containing protein n=1 Tax=Seriola dumerili TaxID=41447 RepID=A0A3B4VFA1_SERDU
MKTVIVALFVVLVVSHSEALRCHCGGIRDCLSPVETCQGEDNVCENKTFSNDPLSFFYVSTVTYRLNGCYKSTNCPLLNRLGLSSGSCCKTDLCNRYE